MKQPVHRIPRAFVAYSFNGPFRQYADRISLRDDFHVELLHDAGDAESIFTGKYDVGVIFAPGLPLAKWASWARQDVEADGREDIAYQILRTLRTATGVINKDIPILVAEYNLPSGISQKEWEAQNATVVDARHQDLDMLVNDFLNRFSLSFK